MLTKHPKEMTLLALTEMSQRFAFFGIANILVIYLTKYQGFGDGPAEHLFGLLTGIGFILPILGGYLADHFHYHLPIRWGICLSALGCFLLSLDLLPLLHLGLLCLSLGCGILIPSMYALLSALYAEHPFREGGFALYYSLVNLGTFIALLMLGFLGHVGHWQLAFCIAGGVQLLGLFPLFYALKNPLLQHTCASPSAPAPPLTSKDKDRVLIIWILSFFSIFFWIGYNQGGSSLSLFALHYTDRFLGNVEIPAAWFFSSEICYLLILTAPLVSLYIYLKKKQLDLSPFVKYALGLVCLGVCFFIMKKGAEKAILGSKVDPFYLLSAYGFMALGEILIFPIGISLVTRLCPKRRSAFFVGVWYFCIGVAFYLGGLIAPWMSSLKKAADFFNLFILASSLAAFSFCLLIPYLKRKSHFENLR